jgi:site-specific DNA-methyltransferase (cytosine-N4-specific)
MQTVFENLIHLFKAQAPFALVVGHNHTVIGGQRYDINTPRLLADVAIRRGWVHKESIPLQTYQRYDLHSSNAVKQETLLVLRRT